jgi:hypothetical protein
MHLFSLRTNSYNDPSMPSILDMFQNLDEILLNYLFTLT